MQILITKKYNITLIILSLLALSMNAQNEFHLFEKKIYTKKAENNTQFANNYDIIYHRIHWNIDPAEHYISGSVFSIFTITEATDNILFNLSSKLKVDSIIGNEQHIAYTHNNDIIKVSISAPKNSTDSLTIYYSGKPANTGFGSFKTMEHNGHPVMWTLSEPYGAQDWWPCKQSLIDKPDSVDIAVTVPPGNKAASLGVLTRTETNSNGVTFYWKHRHPVATYLIAVAVTNYEEFTIYAHLHENDSMPVLNFVYPESYNTVYNQILYTTEVIEVFSRELIPYPYKDEKYGHAQFGWSGGMEHQTMSFMGAFTEGLIAHELAHQWFGNHVTCGSWQDLWVNEGFATWCECLAIEHLNPDFYQSSIEHRITSAVAETKSGALYVTDTTDIDLLFKGSHTYNKGGMVLHQLRHQIGDSAFFKGVKAMLNSNMHFVKTPDVQNFFEQSSGTSLKTYFNNWIYGEGYPIYTFELKKGNFSEVVLEISQSTTHESTLFFPLKVPVLFEGDNDTTLLYFNNTEKQQEFPVYLPFDINTIKFDPEYTIIARHPARIIYEEDRKLIEEKIIAVPNPAYDSLKIFWLDTFTARRIEIYNAAGKEIYNTPVSVSPNFHNVDISGFESGEYIIKVFSGRDSITTKFIKG